MLYAHLVAKSDLHGQLTWALDQLERRNVHTAVTPTAHPSVQDPTEELAAKKGAMTGHDALSAHQRCLQRSSIRSLIVRCQLRYIPSSHPLYRASWDRDGHERLRNLLHCGLSDTLTRLEHGSSLFPPSLLFCSCFMRRLILRS